MRRLFIDAVFFIALIDRKDRFHQQAAAFDLSAINLRLVTSDAVLTELLAYFAAKGPHLRLAAINLISLLNERSYVTIIRQTPELFDAALDLYRRRPDKAYSLVDCMSMVICQEQDIGEVLTHDHHFEQEGFTILL